MIFGLPGRQRQGNCTVADHSMAFEDGAPAKLRLSPDGKFIIGTSASARNRDDQQAIIPKLVVCEVQTGEQQWSAEKTSVEALAVSPDSRSLMGLAEPESIPRGKDYASLIESDVPIVVQHSRLDSRQSENALMTTVAYCEVP